MKRENGSKFLLIFFLAVLPFGVVYAQNLPELITDRPDVTESAVTVPEDFWQIETGIMYGQQKYFDDSFSVENKNLDLGSTLLRYGVNERLELRLGGEYFNGKSTSNSVSQEVQGLTGLLIGSKYVFIEDGEIINHLACLVEIQLPFGNENLRPQNLEPTFIIAAGKEINNYLDLTVNLGLEYKSDIIKYNSFYSASLGIELGNRWGMFAEYFGNALKGLSPKNNADCGLTYLLKENIQIDAFAGSVFLSSDTDWFFGLGLSTRLPK